MVHPTELLRTNSNSREFSAPINAVAYQPDCGLTNLPILNRCCNLERLATPNVFLIVLSLVGLMQGVTLTFFRDTSIIWGKHYNIDQRNIEWLIYTNEFFVGIIALLVSYYGNIIHRTSWIGGLVVFQAIASGLLIVPEIYKRAPKQQFNMTDLLCLKDNLFPDPKIEINFIALAIIVIFQIFFAMASISFISHGITYLDDNTSTLDSPSYIAVALACKELGKQAGLYFSWIPIFFDVDNVFLSPMWLSITVMVFISGTLIAMFPKNMPSVLMKTMSASIVDLASGYEVTKQGTKKVDGFFKTIWRLLKNKILITNIFCVAILEAGIINFNIFEKQFNQSSFQISQVNDSSYTQFATNILKQPLVALVMVTTGIVAAKAKPHLKSLVKWNIIVLVLVIVFFGSTAFLRCDPGTKYSHMLDKPLCTQSCNCTFDVFRPVCVNSKTYYSPCFAGCSKIKEENSKKYFSNCICGGFEVTAREGPCNEQKCDLFYAFSQVNRVITTALLSSTIITNIIINMRCVLSEDKAPALGLDATLTSLISYLPIKAIYGAIADTYCIFVSNEVCKLYTRNLSTFLSVSTIILMFVSLLLSVVVLILLRYYPIEEKKEDDIGSQDVELRPMRARDEVDFQVSSDTIPDSLAEMVNVGDDHDSIESGAYLDSPRTYQRRLMESDL